MIQALGQRVADICIMVLLRLFNSLAVFVALLFCCFVALLCILFICFHVFMFFSYCACDDFVILSQMCLIIA